MASAPRGATCITIFLLIFALVILSTALHASSSQKLSFSFGSDFEQTTCSQDVSSTTSPSSKIRMLHHIDKPTYDSIMDRWFARSHLDFFRASHLVEHAVLWGPGWPEYNDTLSLVENVYNRYGRDDYFDAVLPYWNGDQTNWLGLDPVPMFFGIRALSEKGTIVVDRPHEMRDDRRVPIIDLANVSIILCPYPNECFDYRRYASHVLIVHQPHPVELGLFSHPIRHPDGSVIERPRDVILAGSLETGLYPFRRRLGDMINDQKLRGWIRPHPGYPDVMVDTEKHRLGITLNWLEKQLQDYSDDLGDSKICLVTSSRWGYSVQKYGEAAAAGCLIIGTIPLDRQSHFSDFVVPISMNSSDEEIINVVNHYLLPENEDLRLKKAEAGQKYFTRHFSGERYVEDVVGWIHQVKQGRRGMVFPYDWEILSDPPPWDG